MKKKKNNSKLILLSFLAIIIVIIILLIIKIIKQNSYTIQLNGSEVITIYEKENYNEPGYIVLDYNNNEVYKEVKIDSNLDINTPGEYTIIYKIPTFLLGTKTKRTVIVQSNPIANAKLELIGDEYIELNLNDTYTDQGIKCNLDGNDCTSKLTKDTNLNTSKLGSYYYNYTLTVGNKSAVKTRNIIVKGENYSFKLSNNNPTNQDIQLTFISNINDDEFISIKDIENNTITTDIVINKITQNGEYTYYINKSNGSAIEAKISITNIDKEKPTGTCSAQISSNKTTFTLNVKDNDKVDKYKFNNQEYSGNFTINSKVTGGDVIAYDRAGNSNTIKCSYLTEPKKPSNVSIKYESDTLKYYIVKTNDEYLNYIWMKNPNKQMKIGLGGNPSGLRKTNEILNSEISANKLSNKGLIGANGSFFTSSSFDEWLYSYDHAWRNTQIGPVFFKNGTVVRDFTKYMANMDRGFDLVGITKDNVLKKYTFSSKMSFQKAQEVVQKMKDDGIQNSFTFQVTLVKDKKAQAGDSEKASRTGICQIDNNNFVLYSSRSQITLGHEANAMVSAGCVTGFNLDGGGSRNLYYKLGNGSLTSLSVTSRAVADVIYFTEQ